MINKRITFNGCYEEGRIAFQDNLYRSDNPYKEVDESRAQDWDEGWIDERYGKTWDD